MYRRKLGLKIMFPIYYLKGEDRNTSPKKLFVVMRTVVLKYEHSVLSSVNFKRTFWCLQIYQKNSSGWLGVARGGSGWLGLNGLFPIYYLKGEDRNTSPKKLFE